jgi:hypothetical protein
VSDPRIDSLTDEAMRLRLSRRSIMRRGAALGLSTAAISGVLATTGKAAPARRAPAFIQERTLKAGSTTRRSSANTSTAPGRARTGSRRPSSS